MTQTRRTLLKAAAATAPLPCPLNIQRFTPGIRTEAQKVQQRRPESISIVGFNHGHPHRSSGAYVKAGRPCTRGMV